MAQDQKPTTGLLPPPPLLPSSMLPLPNPPPLPLPQHPTQLPPPLPIPPATSHYQPYQPPLPQGFTPQLASYQTSGLQGPAGQSQFNSLAYATAAASQMMLGNILAMDQFSQAAKRHKHRRSPSPKRRHRSRSDSPIRHRRGHSPSEKKRSGKRRRNRSPQHKPASSAPARRSPVRPDKSNKAEAASDNIYQPPTPPKELALPENGSKTPEYRSDYNPPKTPEYDGNGTVTPPQPEINTDITRKSTPTKSPDKPAIQVPKFVCLKKVLENNDTMGSPSPKLEIKSLTDILREQALQSMQAKRKTTPDPQPKRKTSPQITRRSASPILNRSLSPELDRSTTKDTEKLSNPFADVDTNQFVAEDSQDDLELSDRSESRIDSDSEDGLLSDNLQEILIKVTKPKSKKKDAEKKLLKEEKKKVKELKRQLKEAKKSKKIALKHKSVKRVIKRENTNDTKTRDNKVNSKDTNGSQSKPGVVNWQRNLITNLFSDVSNENKPTNSSPSHKKEDITPPGTPKKEDAEFLKTPEKCDQIFFDEYPETNKTEVKQTVVKQNTETNTLLNVSTKRSKRKVVILNKKSPNRADTSTFKSNKITAPVRAPAQSTSIKTTSPPKSILSFGTQSPFIDSSTTIRQLNPNKASFNPFASNNNQLPNISKISTGNISSSNSTVGSKPTVVKTNSTKTTSSVKTIRRIKPKQTTSSAPAAKPTIKQPPPAAKLTPAVPSTSAALDDFEKELELLNAALTEAPSTDKKTPSSHNTTNFLHDEDEDLFADIEQMLKEDKSFLN